MSETNALINKILKITLMSLAILTIAFNLVYFGVLETEWRVDLNESHARDIIAKVVIVGLVVFGALAFQKGIGNGAFVLFTVLELICCAFFIVTGVMNVIRWHGNVEWFEIVGLVLYVPAGMNVIFAYWGEKNKKAEKFQWISASVVLILCLLRFSLCDDKLGRIFCACQSCFVAIFALFPILLRRYKNTDEGSCDDYDASTEVTDDLTGGLKGNSITVKWNRKTRLTSNAREIVMNLVNWVGIFCLLGVVIGCFLPFFKYGKISFVQIIGVLFKALTDEHVRYIAEMAGYEQIIYLPFIILALCVGLYILSWKAFRRTVDYTRYPKYAWNITLMVSSLASYMSFSYVKGCIDWLGTLVYGTLGDYIDSDISGRGLILIVTAYFVLFILAIVSVVVKLDYNNEKMQLEKREAISEEEKDIG